MRLLQQPKLSKVKGVISLAKEPTNEPRTGYGPDQEHTITKAVFNELELQDLTRDLLGKILTIVDASMEDPVRRKAMKDLIVDRFWDANWKIVDWMKAGGKEEQYPFRTYSFNPEIPRE